MTRCRYLLAAILLLTACHVEGMRRGAGDAMPVEPGLSWARNIDGLIECCGKLLIYTLSEYLARRAVRDAGAQS